MHELDSIVAQLVEVEDPFMHMDFSGPGPGDKREPEPDEEGDNWEELGNEDRILEVDVVVEVDNDADYQDIADTLTTAYDEDEHTILDSMRYTDEDVAKYGWDEVYRWIRSDHQRLEQFEAGVLHMVGIRARAKIYVNGAVTMRYSPGLWEIESDSDEDYMQEVGEEELKQLEPDLELEGFDLEYIREVIRDEAYVYDKVDLVYESLTEAEDPFMQMDLGPIIPKHVSKGPIILYTKVKIIRLGWPSNHFSIYGSAQVAHSPEEVETIFTKHVIADTDDEIDVVVYGEIVPILRAKLRLLGVDEADIVAEFHKVLWVVWQ